ncbi:MAG: glycosyltransferase [Bacteroidota bacterium]
MKGELVSVVIPTHNRPELLGRAVASVVRQTYTEWEIIVVDDGSKEAAEPALRSTFPDYEKQIRVVRHNQPRGACAARNTGVEHAKGFWLSFLDDDDEYTEERLSRLLEVMELRPDYAFVCSDYLDLRLNGNRLSQKGGEMDAERVLWSNITTPSVLTVTNYVRAIGGWDESLSAAQDHDLYLRLLIHYGTAYRIPEVLYIYHQEHLGPRITNNPQKKFRGYFEFYLKHKARMSKQQRAYYLYKLLGVQGKSRRLFQHLFWVPRRFFPSEINNILLEKTKLYRWLGPSRSK